jgi:hypothetical protein
MAPKAPPLNYFSMIRMNVAEIGFDTVGSGYDPTLTCRLDARA